MQQYPLVWLDDSFENRVERILRDYVIGLCAEFVALHGEEAGFEQFAARLRQGMANILKRLGGERHKRMTAILDEALQRQQASGEVGLHRGWIEGLLREYYDPIAKARPRASSSPATRPPCSTTSASARPGADPLPRARQLRARGSLQANAVDAAIGIAQQVLLALHLGVGADHLAEQLQLRAAEPLADGGRCADRAVVLDQQPVRAIGFHPRHVALAGAHLGELLQAPDHAVGLAGLAVERTGLALALADQAVHALLPEQLPH
uniref:tRNA 2-selenouridine synthase AAA domain-containing protein n=1 Tax=Anopheles melas TaxID=34690 RepID=A0A182UAT6_9DIPT